MTARCKCGDPACTLWREDEVCAFCSAKLTAITSDPEFEGRGGDMGEGHYGDCPHGYVPPASAPAATAGQPRFVVTKNEPGIVEGRWTERPIVTGTHTERGDSITISRREYDALHATDKAELTAELLAAEARLTAQATELAALRARVEEVARRIDGEFISREQAAALVRAAVAPHQTTTEESDSNG